MDDFIDQIAQEGQKVEGTKAYFVNKNLESVPFSQEYYRQLTGKAGNASYIDGGNAVLINSGALSVQYIRVAAVQFENGKRAGIQRKECYLVVRAEMQDKLRYVANVYPVEGEWDTAFVFDAVENGSTVPIETVGEMVRRLSELDLALNQNGLVVLDGTLEARFKGEEERLQILSGKDVVAVAKTSTLLTDAGTLFTALLAHHAPAGIWEYYPVANGPFFMRFCKFHEASKHIFRVDSFREIGLDVLVENSRDVIFPGYPYGLVLVDRVARVSNREQELLRAKLLARTGKAVERQLSSSDAHRILDSA